MAMTAMTTVILTAGAAGRPRLLYYIDRTSIRLPAAWLEHLADGCSCAACCTRRERFIIKIRVPPWARAERERERKRLELEASAPQMDDEDVYEMEGVVGAKRFKKDCGAYVAESSSEGAAGASSSSSSSSFPGGLPARADELIKAFHGTPVATTAAIAASAFDTLCRPGTFSRT